MGYRLAAAAGVFRPCRPRSVDPCRFLEPRGQLRLLRTGVASTRTSAIEQRQAAAFVAAVAHVPYPAVPIEGQTLIADLVALAEAYLGADRALEVFRQHLDLPALAATD